MTADELKMTVLEVFGETAPEADLANLEPDATFHEQYDIDSMDYVNFVVALGKALHVTIPEEDYYQLATLNGCIAYLSPRLAATA